MNANLLAIVRRIIAEQGEYILSYPRWLRPFIKNYAQHVPQEERRALGRCIENGAYSVLKTALFYYYSPFKSTSIVVNYNRSANFNHQFNAVVIDGQRVFVEPQARTGRSYDLRQFWDSRYNPSYNQIHNTTWLFLPRGVSGTEE